MDSKVVYLPRFGIQEFLMIIWVANYLMFFARKTFR